MLSRALVVLGVVVFAPAARAQVRLSQIYAGGGNVGATHISDYVELYNAGAPQSLAGWSIQYATAAGASWSVTALPNVTLATGQYLLVRQSEGTSLASGQALALPAPDASATGGGVAMNATDGKVALCNSTTALPNAHPNTTAIVDFVGYGPLAGWREPFVIGSAADNAPSPSVALALFRRSCGASDSNDNNSDWAVGTPSPRTRATALSNGVSASGLASPYFAEAGQSTRLVVSPFACASDAPIAGATVLVNASSLGGSSAFALVDDGTAGDELAGDGLYSASLTVGASAPATTHSLPFTVSAGAQSGGGFIALVVAPSATPDHDTCSRAITLGPAFPASYAGDFTNAKVEGNPLVAVTAPNTPANAQGARRGVWFRVAGTGGELVADTCASPVIGVSTIPDTVLAVFTGTCDGLALLAFNDDNPTTCGAGAGTERRSRVAWCSVLGDDYFVWVAPFATSAQSFAYTLTLSAGTACSPSATGSVCAPAAASLGTIEEEPAFGPATNDGCDSSPQRFTDLAPATPALVVHGSSRSYADQRDADWYRLQAPADGLLRVGCVFASRGTLELRRLSATGSCTTNTLIDSATAERCATVNVSTPALAGQWFAARIASTGASPGTFGGVAVGASSAAYRAEFELGGTPANDECAAASALALDWTYANGATSGASADGTSTCDLANSDVWYAITTPHVGRLEIDTCGSSSSASLALFTSCGGSQVACSSSCATPGCGAGSCLTIPGLPAGAYRLRVSAGGTPGAFRVRARVVIENDDCAGAVALSCLALVSGSTSGASGEAGLAASCPGPGEATHGGSFAITAPGVWYSLTLPGVAGIDDRTVYADTLSSAFDTRITVFSGACGALACVTSNDDMAPAPGFGSKVGWRAVAGETYFVLVHGFASSTGAFTLRVACAAPVANDDCASAQAIGPYAGATAGTTEGATGEPYSFATGGPGGMATCAGVTGDPSTFSYFDVWYRFDAQCDASATLSTCGSLDTVLSVHVACPTQLASNALADLCSDDAPGGCAPGSSVTWQTSYGSTYWIRVAQADGASAGGSFTLSWSFADTDGDGADDCVDGCVLDPFKTSPGVCGCGFPDTDGDADGAPDCVDGCPSDPQKTSPGECGCSMPDTDSDSDGTADCLDACPLDPAKVAPGACGCGVADVDSDGDGALDCLEDCDDDPLKTVPGVCGCGVADVDSDGDATLDCLDGCPLDPLKVAPGVCGCGVADDDSDGDGALDCVEDCDDDPLKTSPGVCGCGVSDVDSDGDGTADCLDLCPDDPLKQSPGQCGCSAPDIDSDGDGTADCIDLCPFDPAKTSPGSCGCGVADLDLDRDGVVDCIDNCAALANPTQADCDSDGVGDACEIAFGGAHDTDGDGVPDECQSGLAIGYCSAGTSTNGCAPALSSTGTPSVASASGFELVASAVEGQRTALFFYGLSGPLSDPWGGSTSVLCVKAPTQRTFVINSAGSAGTCSGSARIDWLAFVASQPSSLGAPHSAGELVWAQLWYRDPLGPKSTALSSGLQFTLAP